MWRFDRAVEPTRHSGSVVWFTGVSGAGKSTIADWVAARLSEQRCRVERLDGDAIRGVFPSTGFSRTDRNEHLKRTGYMASRLAHHDVIVLASFVSPYRESREFARQLCPSFIEVYVSTPIEVCERRDVKGLYAKARRGELKNLTGIDDPYEPPVAPEVSLDTTFMTVADAGAIVLARLGRELTWELPPGSDVPARGVVPSVGAPFQHL